MKTPSTLRAGTLGVAAALLSCLGARTAQAVPALVCCGETCMSCHVTLAGAAVTFLDVNGAAAPAPAAVTITPGSGFTFVYRSTGLPDTPYPDVGGAVIPPDTVNWVVSNGPTWTDNGHSGATPWTAAADNVFYCTNYPASDSVDGFQGTTANNGQTGPPADMNGLASNEVMSVSVTVSAALAPGAYSLDVAAMANNGNPVSCSAPFSVYVVAPSPTPSATPTATPSATPPLSPTPSDTAVPAGSTATDTPSATPSFSASPTFTASRTPSASPTAAAAGATVTGDSFPDVDRVAVVPNPATNSRASLYFHVLADAEDIRVRIYTQALVLVRQEDLGPRPGGWNSAPLPAFLPNGLYYVTAGPVQGPYDRPSRPAVLCVLR